MTREIVFNLIANNKNNLIKIGKAIRTDFEGVLGYYRIFEKLSLEKALLKVTEDIVEAYENKLDIWEDIQKDLEY
jgi:hypothetical protein